MPSSRHGLLRLESDRHGLALGHVLAGVFGEAVLPAKEPIDECIKKMKRAGCRHLPIEVDGRVISMIAMRDLLHDEIEEQTDELRMLRAYVHQTPLRS